MKKLLSSKYVARLTAVFITFFALLTFLFVVVMPTNAWYVERNNLLYELQKRKSHLTQTVILHDQVLKDLAASKLEKYKDSFLVGEDTAVIAAELQSRLRAVMTARKCELSSARILPAKEWEGQNLIGVRAQIRCSIKRMRNVLHILETSKPFLFVDRMILRLESPRGARRDLNEEALTAMYAEFDVFGAKWKDTDAKAHERTTR